MLATREPAHPYPLRHSWLDLLPPAPEPLPLLACTRGRFQRHDAEKKAHHQLRALFVALEAFYGLKRAPTDFADRPAPDTAPLPPLRRGRAPHPLLPCTVEVAPRSPDAWLVDPTPSFQRPRHELYNPDGTLTDDWYIESAFDEAGTGLDYEASVETGLFADLSGLTRESKLAADAFADATSKPGDAEMQAIRTRWNDELSDEDWGNYDGPERDPDEALIDLNQDFACLHREYTCIQRRLSRLRRHPGDYNDRRYQSPGDEKLALRGRLVQIRVTKDILIEEGQALKERRNARSHA